MSVETIFAAAAQKLPAERAAYLNEACGTDEELRRKVERLLKAHDAAGEFLEAPLERPIGTIDYAPIAEKPGMMIGPYKLKEQIGEGGFGLVFVAEQQEPVKRKVALKVIKPGMDTREVMARFTAERQALALMDHPNIARVLDAGATDSGRPYFVMELVRGIPITEYCDQNQLSPKDRLELFVTVCQAIQHAHQKGIIHRDVKPSNVLVTLHDGKPVAKVIDFGVAKAVHQQLTDRSIYTNFATMVGTPLYMSPEQAEMSGLDIDTRSDIYSLGVLLYELLTGTTPLEKKKFAKAAYDEIRRLIREEEPPKPSTRLSSSDAIASIASHRHTEPAKLSRLMRGDLDWITMKCLEKDRTRRYETANGLARDIQRYLSDEPVEACPPSTMYRMRKFARKNRAALTTAAAIAALLVVGIAVTSWQAMRAAEAERNATVLAEAEKHQRQAAEEQRDRAIKAEKDALEAKEKAGNEAAIARAVTNFLQNDILAQSSPFRQGRGNVPTSDLSLREALDRAAASIDRRFAQQPIVEATVRDTIANAYLEFGLLDKALQHAEGAVNTLRAAGKEDDPAILKPILHLAWILLVSGRLSESETLHRELYERSCKLLRENDSLRWNAVSHYATCLAYRQKYGEAESMFQQVLDAAQQHKRNDTDLQMTRNNLALMYQQQGRCDEAESMFQTALSEHRRLASPLHPNTLLLLNNLAGFYMDHKQFDRAEPLWRESAAGHRQVFGPEAARTRNAVAHWSYTLLALRQFDVAEPPLRELLAVREKLEPDAAVTFHARSMLGETLLGQKKFDEAEPLLLKGYEGLKKRETAIPAAIRKVRLTEALDRLVRFYTDRNQPPETEKWKAELEKLRVTDP